MQMLARWREFEHACEPKLILALIAENEAFEDGMRSLASTLGTGGYNAVTLSAARLVDKVQWGVNHLADASGRLADDLRAERDRLKAENEALRKDAERLQSATAFVQKLCDAAGKQPSVATGYLHDILSAMGNGEQS
jgi:hypothetical protein